MPWPAFNELGDLPVGVHRAMLAEVIAHLGSGTVQRVTITARLERIYELPRQTNAVQRCIIFGSDITTDPTHRTSISFSSCKAPFNRETHRPKPMGSSDRPSTTQVGCESRLGQCQDKLCRYGRSHHWLADAP